MKIRPREGKRKRHDGAAVKDEEMEQKHFSVSAKAANHLSQKFHLISLLQRRSERWKGNVEEKGLFVE